MIEVTELGLALAHILEFNVSGLDFMYIFAAFSRPQVGEKSTTIKHRLSEGFVIWIVDVEYLYRNRG